MNLPILFETNWYLVLDKPHGLNVERLPQGFPSIEEWVDQYQIRKGIKKPYTGIVHRLDRPVGGVLIVAKKKLALKILNEQFRERKIKKQYLALVEGHPQKTQDQLIHWIEKDQRHKKAIAHIEPRKKAVKGVLQYQTMQQLPDTSRLKIFPLSGKFHQIRVQLSTIGCPIVGDEKYGATTKFRADAIALYAQSITFQDPLDGRSISIEGKASF